MKKIGIVFMVLVLAVGLFAVDSMDLFAGKVSADEAVKMNVVSVNGVGEITVEPDVAYINIGVETRDLDAAIAQQENAKRMEEVINALKKAGITEDDMKTTNFSIYQHYNYNFEEPKIEYHVVNNTLMVTINDVDNVGAVIDAAAVNGSNRINSINFGVKDETKYYEEALKVAMTNAEGKASAIMSVFGEKPGKPSSVSEHSYGGGIRTSSVSMDMNMAKAEFATPISAGDLTISATVSVEYSY